MFIFFKNDHTRAFPHHKTVAGLVIGARSLASVRSLKSRRHSAQGAKSGNTNPANRRFGAACNHHIGIIQRDQPRGIAYRMRAGGTSRHH